MLLLSLMLLGLDAVQLTALREAKLAYYFSVASQQLHLMQERLASVRTFDMEAEMAIWNKQNREVLPQGRGSMSGHYPNVDLVLFWGNTTEKTCQHNRIGQSGCLRLANIR